MTFKCHVCGHDVAKSELVSEVFNLGGRRVLVERIPALVCKHCGEVTFSRETTEHVRRLVHGEDQPIKTVSMDVFAIDLSAQVKWRCSGHGRFPRVPE